MCRQNRSAWASRATAWCCCATARPSGRCPASTPGRTDLDLTDNGRAQAVAAGREPWPTCTSTIRLVISSPRRRALDTAELAGLTVDEKSAAARRMGLRLLRGPDDARRSTRPIPDWLIWTHGAPDGETRGASQRARGPGRRLGVGAMESRDVVFVGHGHFSRAVITRWVELPSSRAAVSAWAPPRIAVVRLRTRHAPAQRAGAQPVTRNRLQPDDD